MNQPPPIRLELLEAIGELFAQRKLTAHQVVYGLRIAYRAGAQRIFSESLESSSRALGWSDRKTAQRARKRFIALGILQPVGKKPGPGHAARFLIKVPSEIIHAAGTRNEATSTEGTTLPPFEGASQGTPASPVVSRSPRDGGLGDDDRGTLAGRTRDSSAPIAGLNGAPQTQEPNNRENRRSLPASPRSSLITAGTAGRRRADAQEEVSIALKRAPAEQRDQIAARLNVLSEMFLTCGQVADESRLRGYCRTTSEIPLSLLKGACDAARASGDNPRGFPPSEARINAEGRALVARTKKQARIHANRQSTNETLTETSK